MVEAVRRDLRDLLGVEAPAALRARREVAALDGAVPPRPRRTRRAHPRATARVPALALAGNAFDGAGLPDCVRGGEAAAESLLKVLTS